MPQVEVGTGVGTAVLLPAALAMSIEHRQLALMRAVARNTAFFILSIHAEIVGGTNAYY
jgi:hypothetical protein